VSPTKDRTKQDRDIKCRVVIIFTEDLCSLVAFTCQRLLWTLQWHFCTWWYQNAAKCKPETLKTTTYFLRARPTPHCVWEPQPPRIHTASTSHRLVFLQVVKLTCVRFDWQKARALARARARWRERLGHALSQGDHSTCRREIASVAKSNFFSYGRSEWWLAGAIDCLIFSYRCGLLLFREATVECCLRWTCPNAFEAGLFLLCLIFHL
jgi:hypothetical protein